MLWCMQPSVHSPEVKLPPPPSAGKGRPGGKATFQLSAAMAGMAAVEQQRMQLMRHTRTFTDRVAAFLCQQFDDIATQTIADVRGYTGECRNVMSQESGQTCRVSPRMPSLKCVATQVRAF